MQAVEEVMTVGCESIDEDASIVAVAKTMQRLGVGSLPIRGGDDKLIGMLTDRDIVLQVIAEGKDPSSTTAGQLAGGAPACARTSDSVDQAIDVMRRHRVRRVPVVDDDDTLAGLVSLGDIATSTDSTRAGVLLQNISARSI